MKKLRQLRLKRNIFIPKGTIFDDVSNEGRQYGYDNFSTLVGLTKDSCGEFIYGFDNLDEELIREWFEYVE